MGEHNVYVELCRNLKLDLGVSGLREFQILGCRVAAQAHPRPYMKPQTTRLFEDLCEEIMFADAQQSRFCGSELG